MFERRDTLDSLADLLDRERIAVLNGDFSALKRLVHEKERLIGAAQTQKLDGRTLQNLREKSASNNAMLMAATNGIRAARRRLSEQKISAASLQTYDKSGHHVSHSTNEPTLERRA